MFFSGSQVHTELDTLLLTSPAGREPCPLVEVPVILEEGVDPPGACRLMNLAKCSNILCAVCRFTYPFWGCTEEYILPAAGGFILLHHQTPYGSV